MRPLAPILAVTGLASEARIAAGPGIEVVCSGCDPARLRAALAGLVRNRYRAIISFGISGALDPSLKPGQVIVATEITSDAGAWPVAASLARTLAERLSSLGQTITCASLVGVNAPVIEAGSKALLRQRTGAASVDMESHVAASFAAEAGVPVCAIRVISDPAHRNLPPLATQAMRADGRLNVPAVMASLVRNPSQIPLMVRAGRDAGSAFAALRRVRRLLDFGLGLGGADLR
jgi:hopanoid-associated phosphorylase